MALVDSRAGAAGPRTGGRLTIGARPPWSRNLEVRTLPGIGRSVFATRLIPAGSAWFVTGEVAGSSRGCGYAFPISDQDAEFWSEALQRRVTNSEARRMGLNRHIAQTARLHRASHNRTPHFRVSEANVFMAINDGVYRPGMSLAEYAASGQRKVNVEFLTRLPRRRDAPVDLTLVTLRAVAPGEQLLVAYGTEFWFDTRGNPREL